MDHLLRKYLLHSVATFTPPDEAGTVDADAEADKAGGKDAAGSNADADNAGDGKSTKEGDGDGDKGADADADAAAKEAAEAAKQLPWVKKRIAELGRAGRVKDRELNDIKATLKAREDELAQIRAQITEEGGATKPGDTRTKEQIDFEINARAEQIAASRSSLREITRESDRVYEAGVAKYGEELMDAALKTFGSEEYGFGGLRDDLVKAVIRIPNGHDVMYHLGNNPGEIDRIYKMDPIELAIEVTKMATKLAAPPPRRAATNAPKPIEPIGGKGGNADTTAPDDKDDTSTWMQKRNADLQKRGVRL